MFTGKAELGQASKTAFSRIAAEELDMPLLADGRYRRHKLTAN